MEIAMVGDKIMPLEDATISAHDRSIYFGDGVYEAIRICNGKLFAYDMHMARLKNSLEKMDMLENTDLDQISKRVSKALDAASIPNAMLYFHITRGEALRMHDYHDNWQPGFLLTIRNFSPRKERTATAITHPDWRWKRCDIKSLNLLANIMAKHTATKSGDYDALLIDDNGLITESTSSTVIIVKGNTLMTAPLTANILPGITRALLLDWAKDAGLKAKEQSFTLKETLQADEVMITGTSTEVLGITRLDGQTIADGKPGHYTKILYERLLSEMASL